MIQDSKYRKFEFGNTSGPETFFMDTVTVLCSLYGAHAFNTLQTLRARALLISLKIFNNWYLGSRVNVQEKLTWVCTDSIHYFTRSFRHYWSPVPNNTGVSAGMTNELVLYSASYCIWWCLNLQGAVLKVQLLVRLADCRYATTMRFLRLCAESHYVIERLCYNISQRVDKTMECCKHGESIEK